MNARITEVLPEGPKALWITLDDGLTRLVHFAAPLLESRSQIITSRASEAKVTPDGRYIRWSSGEFVTVEMVGQATAETAPLRLLALFPQQRRYRPILPLLQPMHVYLDVRPASVMRANLCLKSAEWDRMLRVTAGIPQELVLARVSDFYLLLTGLFPFAVLPVLMRQAWPMIKRDSGSPLIETVADCLVNGEFDLIEYPLIRLLQAQHREIGDVWSVLKSERETSECPAAEGSDAGWKTGR